MKIQIKNSNKPVNYIKAIHFLEKRLAKVSENSGKELIWLLEHESVYTVGIRYKESEVLDKSIKIIKTNRGGKLTYHGPGQIVCYFVINLNQRKRDIRNFVKIIENSIIQTLKEYNIESFKDRNNIGIFVKQNNQVKKVAAIGVKIKKWIAYHGFSLNLNVDLNSYKKIIPCGLLNKGITNLKSIKKQDYSKIKKKIIKNLIRNLGK